MIALLIELVEMFKRGKESPITMLLIHFKKSTLSIHGECPECIVKVEEKILIDHPERSIRIPMISDARCLNLSNSVAIVVYEALRQNNFESLTKESDYLYGIID